MARSATKLEGGRGQECGHLCLAREISLTSLFVFGKMRGYRAARVWRGAGGWGQTAGGAWQHILRFVACREDSARHAARGGALPREGRPLRSYSAGCGHTPKKGLLFGGASETLVWMEALLTIVPGSRSTRTARGTYLPPVASL
jgi:hypothetical protein